MSVNELSNFYEVENLELRAHNRGCVLANITERYLDNGGISAKRLEDFLLECSCYIKQFPVDERAAAKVACKTELTKRGVISGS